MNEAQNELNWKLDDLQKEFRAWLDFIGEEDEPGMYEQYLENLVIQLREKLAAWARIDREAS